MSDKLIDLYSRILKYNNNTIYIAFENKTQNAYFNANQVCDMLEYKDYRDALRSHVNKQDIKYLKDIVKNYKTLYKNVQGHTKFINEGGLFSLILKSKMKKAVEIADWITHEVMPSIRKHGEYKLTHELKTQIDHLNKEIEILRHNLKSPRFSSGESVYILQNIEDNSNININADDILNLKFGRTKDINKRIKVYNTSNKNKIKILKVIPVENSKIIEECVINKMDEFKIKDNKEYFKCTFNQLIEQIANCIKFFEERDINMEIENNENSQLKRVINEFGFSGKKFYVKILHDFDLIEDSDNEHTDEELSDSDDETIQKGGSDNMNYKYMYMKSKLKYLELKYDLLNEP